MHLLRASTARLRATAEALEAAGVGLVAPLHCTGRRGKDHLRRRFGDVCEDCLTGSVLAVD